MSSGVANLGMGTQDLASFIRGGADTQATYERAMRFAKGNPNGFDAEWYLAANPDVASKGIDPLQHFQQYGIREGRAPNAFQQILRIGGMGEVPDPASRTNLGPKADPAAATLNASDPASWASFLGRARQETAGLANNLPNTAPSSADLTTNALAMKALFYPQGNNWGYITQGSDPAAAAANASLTGQSAQTLQQQMATRPGYTKNLGLAY